MNAKKVNIEKKANAYLELISRTNRMGMTTGILVAYQLVARLGCY